jgi:hypothetical protein
LFITGKESIARIHHTRTWLDLNRSVSVSKWYQSVGPVEVPLPSSTRGQREPPLLPGKNEQLPRATVRQFNGELDGQV